MHETFLREITVRASINESEAIELFSAVMKKLPDDAINGGMVTASKLLEQIRDEILADREKRSLLRGFSAMFQELTDEMQRRSMSRIREKRFAV